MIMVTDQVWSKRERVLSMKPQLGDEREKREINEKNLDMVIFPRSGFLIRQGAFTARDSLSGGGIVE